MSTKVKVCTKLTVIVSELRKLSKNTYQNT